MLLPSDSRGLGWWEVLYLDCISFNTLVVIGFQDVTMGDTG